MADAGVAADGHAGERAHLYRSGVGAAIRIGYQNRVVAGMVGGDRLGGFTRAPLVAAALGSGEFCPDTATDDRCAVNAYRGQLALDHCNRAAAAAAACGGSCYAIGSGSADGNGRRGCPIVPCVAVATRCGEGGAASCAEGRLARDDGAAEYGYLYALGGGASVTVSEGTGVGAAFVHGECGCTCPRIPCITIGT